MSIATERAALAAQGLDIRPREEWGAVTDYSTSRPVERAIALFLHIAVVDDRDDLVGGEHRVMRNTERVGRTRFGATIGISYNAAAFDTGRLYEGQPLGRRGAHTVNDLPNPAFRQGGLNHLVRALVLPQQVTDPVTDAQIDAAARWGAALIRAGFAIPGARWWGHRDVTRKGCPGDAAYRRLGELNRLTRHYEAHGLKEDTMTPEQERKLDELLAIGRRLAPWPAERIDRQGVVRGDPRAPGSVVTDPSMRWLIETVTGVRTLLGREATVELDASELAAELAALLEPTIPTLSDGDLERVATATANEIDRRARERLG